MPLQQPLEMSSRAVELFRGPRGYGFTLSGQGPCVLSNIVHDSPAALVGLNIGDFVLEANGRNVSGWGHDEVVKWIAGSGQSGSSLKLKIGIPKPNNPSFGSQMGHPKGSIVKPPSFSSFEVAANMRRNGFPNSSSDDETPLTKGQRDNLDFMSLRNNELSRDGNLQPLMGYMASSSSEVKSFVASDDEGHTTGINSIKPPPRLTAAYNHRLTNEEDNRDFKWQSNIKNNITANSSQNNFLLGGFPKPIHVRGHSEDSTLTDGSSWLPSPAAIASRRPKRQSPKKKAARLNHEKYVPRPKHPSPRKQLPSNMAPKATHCQLGGGEELQLLTENEISSFLHPTLDELRKSLKLHKDRNPPNIDLSKVILKVVVGYLGTIEMPKQETSIHPDINQDASPSISLQAIRNCIRRLRVEKKVHTTVLMCIFSQSVILLNHHGITLAEYPSNQITYCGMCTDDKRFLGLVTTRKLSENELMESEEEDEENDATEKIKKDVFSSSCHVFMTETAANADETELLRRAKAFQFEPTKVQNENSSASFVEFPWTAEPIRQAIMSVYGNSTQSDSQHRFGDKENDEEVRRNTSDGPNNLSPGQESNTSSSINSGTTRTSNSDSGIGFKDEVNMGSANVIQAVAEINYENDGSQERESERQDEQRLEGDAEKFHVRVMPPVVMNSIKDDDVSNEMLQNELTNTEVIGSQIEDNSFNTEKLESQNSAENIRQSMQKYLHNKHEHLRRVSEQLALNHISESRQNNPSTSGLEWEDKNANFQANPTLPPYPNPPKYNPVSNTSDLNHKQELNRISHPNRSPLDSSKFNNENIVYDGNSENMKFPMETKGSNVMRGLEDVWEGENNTANGDVYDKDGNSGYSCSGESSLSRDYKAERKALEGFHQSEQDQGIDDVVRDKRLHKYGDKFLLPAFSHKSDSNLSQLISEVETCEGDPPHLTTTAPMVAASRNHKLFLPHSGPNLPDHHLLLPNTTNHKG